MGKWLTSMTQFISPGFALLRRESCTGLLVTMPCPLGRLRTSPQIASSSVLLPVDWFPTVMILHTRQIKPYWGNIVPKITKLYVK